ncbi:MAG: hypothetical protein HYZ27_12305, partial [Deltaproteobacteria bacterium]|nr:hypothetical protein [Deltaproteobacteria bacterium]
MRGLHAAWVPGPGFVVMALGTALSLAVLAFGLATPRLDRVWRMEAELRLGKRAPLSDEELKLFQDALCAHPRLADALVDEADAALISSHRHGLVESGYAYVVRKAKRPKVGVVVAIPKTASHKDVRVSLRALDLEEQAVVELDRPLTFSPQERQGCPTLIEVLVDRGKKRSAKLEPTKSPRP